MLSWKSLKCTLTLEQALLAMFVLPKTDFSALAAAVEATH